MCEVVTQPQLCKFNLSKYFFSLLKTHYFLLFSGCLRIIFLSLCPKLKLVLNLNWPLLFRQVLALLLLKKSSPKMLTGQNSVIFLICVSTVGDFAALEFSLHLASLTCNFPFLTIKLVGNCLGPLTFRQMRMKSFLPSRRFYLCG